MIALKQMLLDILTVIFWSAFGFLVTAAVLAVPVIVGILLLT